MCKATSTAAKASTKTTDNNPRNEVTTAGGEAAEIKQRLEFELIRSAIYHDMRENWYGLINRTFIFITLILSTSAVAAFGAHYPLYGQIAGLVIAGVSALALVWDFGGRSKIHFDLKRRFYSLLSDLQSGGAVTKITASMTLIYADEPPIMHSVNALAHNAAGRSVFGNDFFALHIGVIARFAKNIWPFRADKFRDA